MSSMDQLDDTTKGVGAAGQTHASAAAALKASCQAILAEGAADFGDDAVLAPFQGRVNASLSGAQAHAQAYLDDVHPAMTDALANLDKYFSYFSKVGSVMSETGTMADWVQAVDGMREDADTHANYAADAADRLDARSADMAADVEAATNLAAELRDAGADVESDARLSAIGTLQSQCAAAADAAGKMRDAWQTMTATLDALVKDLKDGVHDSESLELYFLQRADGDIATLLEEIKQAKAQLADA